MYSACLYVIYNPVTKLTKVGMSENVEKRKKDLEGACGVPLELKYATGHLLCPAKYETDAHIKLHEHRMLGEWFNVDPALAIRAVECVIEDATQDPVVEQYKKGDSVSSIAKDAGVTRQAILSRLKGYGLYNNNGKIPEQISVRHVRGREIVATKISDKTEWDVGDIVGTDQIPQRQIESIDNKCCVEVKTRGTIFLDDIKPSLPLKSLKRFEPNVSFNGEWYQSSVYYDGAFINAYSQNIEKIRHFIAEIKTGCKA
jgi:hypothetical protein